MFEQLKKSLSALSSVFNLRNKKRKQERFQKQEGSEDNEEYGDDDIPTIEDENEAMTSIKSGDHGQIKGFNRRVIKGIAVGIIIIFACALMFVVQDSSEPAQQTQIKRDEAANTDKKRSGMPGSYEELAQYNQAQQGKNKQQPPNNNPNNQPQKVTQQDTTQSQQVQQQRPQTLPNIPSAQMPSYTPYQLPSQTAQEDPAEKEAREKEKSLAERLKAAISFGIGGGTASSGQAASNAFQEAAAPSGNPDQTIPGSQPQVQQMSADSNMGMGLTSLSMQTYSPMTIMAGTVIPAALISGINSDTPGQVTAQVQQDVYDSQLGRYLLIPAGSRLIGTFGSDIRNGRVSVTFSMLQLPNGTCFNIGSSLVAVDKAGYTGIKGHVDDHSGKVISNGLVTSAFTALASMAAGNVGNTSGTYSAGQLATQGAVANMINTASTIFNKAANLQSTITVNPGTNFNIYVSAPLDFSGVNI